MKLIFVRIYLLIIAVFSMSACSTLNEVMPWYSPNDVDSITVYVKPDPQLRYAISIDVVFVYKTMSATIIQGMSAREWFMNKDDLMSKYSAQMDLLEWRVINGFGGDKKELPEEHADAIAIFAFANYPPNPNAQVELTNISTPWLIFENGQLKAETNYPLLTDRENNNAGESQ